MRAYLDLRAGIEDTDSRLATHPLVISRIKRSHGDDGIFAACRTADREIKGRRNEKCTASSDASSRGVFRTSFEQDGAETAEEKRV